MTYLEQTVAAGETIAYRTKPHWLTYGRPVAWFAASALGTILAAVLGSEGSGPVCVAPLALAALFTGAWAAAAYAGFLGSEFGVTSRRVLMKSGVLSRTSLELQLAKVEAVSIEQSLVGRIFGFGTVVVSGSGGTHTKFPDIAQPMDFKRAVEDQVHEKQK